MQVIEFAPHALQQLKSEHIAQGSGPITGSGKYWIATPIPSVSGDCKTNPVSASTTCCQRVLAPSGVSIEPDWSTIMNISRGTFSAFDETPTHWSMPPPPAVPPRSPPTPPTPPSPADPELAP